MTPVPLLWDPANLAGTLTPPAVPSGTPTPVIFKPQPRPMPGSCCGLPPGAGSGYVASQSDHVAAIAVGTMGGVVPTGTTGTAKDSLSPICSMALGGTVGVDSAMVA